MITSSLITTPEVLWLALVAGVGAIGGGAAKIMKLHTLQHGKCMAMVLPNTARNSIKFVQLMRHTLIVVRLVRRCT